MDWIFDRRDGARVSDDLTCQAGKVLVLENDLVRVVCLPDKGADIVSFFNKSAGCQCLSAPFVMLPAGTSGTPVTGDDFDRSIFVWPEMFPVASDYGEYFGQVQPVHGEARYQSWRYDIIAAGPDQVAVKLRAEMQMTPFVLTRTMRLARDSATLVLDEEVENRGTEPLPIIWGHHPTFGQPFLEEHCRIYLPEGRLIDGDRSMLEIDPPNSGGGNMFYCVDLAGGYYGLFNHRLNFGVGMRWDHDLFRVIWLWQGYNRKSGSPWFDRVYACAIEPVTSLPKQHKHFGDLKPIIVAPKQRITTGLEVFIFNDPSDLEG